MYFSSIKKEIDKSAKLGFVSSENAENIAALAATKGYNQALNDVKQAYDEAKVWADKAYQLNLDNIHLESALKKAESALKAEKTMRKHYFTKAEQLQARSIPIKDVCYALGLLDKQVSKQSKHDFVSADNRISIDIKKDEPFLWSDFKNGETGRAGAIDLVMHVQGVKFYDACAWLLDRFGDSAVQNDEIAKAQRKSAQNIEFARQIVPKPFKKPVKSDDLTDIENCKIYLAQRGLKAPIINEVISKGFVYPTKMGDYTNIIFCNSENAAEVKGLRTGYKGLSYSSSRKMSAFTMQADKKPTAIMVFESALDLLAYKQENPDTSYFLASVSGVGTNTEVSWILELAKKLDVDNVICGYDNDEAGQQAANALKARLLEEKENINFKIVLPNKGKDWAECVENKNLRGFLPKLNETLEQYLERYEQRHKKVVNIDLNVDNDLKLTQ